MNIMEIVSGAGMNGAILHCLLLSRELARRGNRIALVCRPGAWIAEQSASDPIEVIPSDLHRWPPDELRRIAAIIRQRRIDVGGLHAKLTAPEQPHNGVGKYQPLPIGKEVHCHFWAC